MKQRLNESDYLGDFHFNNWSNYVKMFFLDVQPLIDSISPVV